MSVWRAFILGNPVGRYVRELVAHAPRGLTVTVADFSALQSELRGTKGKLPFDSGQPAEVLRLDSQIVTGQDLIVVRSMSVGGLEPIVFRMDVLASIERQGTAVLNPAKALELAIDKYLSLARMADWGVPVPATHTSQTVEQALTAFQCLGGDVVVKPLFGSEGRGLIRVRDIDHAQRVFRSLEMLGHVIYQQQFIDHGGCDYRVLVLGKKDWTIKRQHASDWRTNRARGAICLPTELPAEIMELSHEVCRRLRLPFAGLDFAQDRSTHQYYLLEINGVPGWHGINQAHGLQIAEQFWAFAQRYRNEFGQDNELSTTSSN